MDSAGTITHSGVPTRVVMRRGTISVGCSDVDIDAARALLEMYDKRFPPLEDVHVIQAGV